MLPPLSAVEHNRDCSRLTDNPSIIRQGKGCRPTGRSPEARRHEASWAAEKASRRQWSSRSDLGHAAIDDQFDAGDIATFVRSEKRHHFGNFVQGSGATERYIAHDAVCVLLDLFFRHPQRIAIAR